MSFNNIKKVSTNGICTITIARPKSLNALNHETLNEIKTAIKEVYDDKEIKGVIITGEGEKAFVAGADIKEIAELNEVNARKFSENGQEVLSLIEQCSKPVIAAVNGFALGGGCELAMACHVRLASANAKFGLPEVNLGLIPGYGGTQRLSQLVGRGKALELIMTGEMISAEEGNKIGLVNHVYATQEELIQAAQQMLEKIFAKAPVAVAMAINSVNAGYSFEEAGYQAEANSFAYCTKTEDFKEGTGAFIEKRKPGFKGE